MRGANIAYKNLFNEPDEAPVISIEKVQGRNPDLNNRRNECLLDRYYFLLRFKGFDYKYEAIVRDVAAAFFISKTMCSKVIIDNTDVLADIKKQWKNEPIDKLAKHLAAKWQHLNWAFNHPA